MPKKFITIYRYVELIAKAMWVLITPQTFKPRFFVPHGKKVVAKDYHLIVSSLPLPCQLFSKCAFCFLGLGPQSTQIQKETEKIILCLKGNLWNCNCTIGGFSVLASICLFSFGSPIRPFFVFVSTATPLATLMHF